MVLYFVEHRGHQFFYRGCYHYITWTCPFATTLLLYCCSTATLLLLYCCSTAILVLLYCCSSLLGLLLIYSILLVPDSLANVCSLDLRGALEMGAEGLWTQWIDLQPIRAARLVTHQWQPSWLFMTMPQLRSCKASLSPTAIYKTPYQFILIPLQHQTLLTYSIRPSWPTVSDPLDQQYQTLLQYQILLTYRIRPSYSIRPSWPYSIRPPSGPLLGLAQLV